MVKKRDWFFFAGLLFVLFLAYKPAWNGKPITDDRYNITQPQLRSVDGLTRSWVHPGSRIDYLPLSDTFFWVEYHLWADWMPGYHLANILLHGIAAFLLLLILRRLGVPFAWFVATLYALHPVQVESTAWVTEQKNNLSALLGFCSVLAFLEFDRDRKKGSRPYALSLVFFVLGMLAKTAIVSLPIALLVIAWWKRGRVSMKGDVVPVTPFLLVGIAAGLVTVHVDNTYASTQLGMLHLSIPERILIAGRAFWFYLGKFFWPRDLLLMYPRWTIDPSRWTQYLFPVAALLAGAMLWIVRKRSRAPLAAYLIFSAMLLPVLGFFSISAYYLSFVADRWQYLACIGPAALVAGGLGAMARRASPWPSRAIAGAVLAACFALTWQQSGFFSSPETMFRQISAKNPTCGVAWSGLGEELMARGKRAEAVACFRKGMELNNADAYYSFGLLQSDAGNPSLAIGYLRKALQITPSAMHYWVLGKVLWQVGREKEAVATYRELLEHFPGNPEPMAELGFMLAKSGDPAQGISCLRDALRIDPACFNACLNLGEVLQSQGDQTGGGREEALELFRRAAKIDPHSFDANYSAGMLLLTTDRAAEAIDYLRAAQAIQPDSSGEFDANMGIALFRANRLAESLDYLERAAKKTGSAANYANLATAYFKSGDQQDAIATIRKAIDLAVRARDAALESQCLNLLHFYLNPGRS